MRDVKKIRWIAQFDMEDLISATLRNGMLLSIGLIVGCFFYRWVTHDVMEFTLSLQARSIPALIRVDLQKLAAPSFGDDFLLHLGVSVLLLTPYARVLFSMLYFAFVERSWKHAFFTFLVLVVLTIGLLTNWV